MGNDSKSVPLAKLYQRLAFYPLRVGDFVRLEGCNEGRIYMVARLGEREITAVCVHYPAHDRPVSHGFPAVKVPKAMADGDIALTSGIVRTLFGCCFEEASAIGQAEALEAMAKNCAQQGGEG